MKSEALFFVLILIFATLFSGDPSLMDAVVIRMMECK